MNLVTTQRTNQQELAKMETELVKLADHVEDLDEHLRGVAGKESMDTRVSVMEKDVFQHGVLLRQIAKHFGSLETMVGEIKTDLAAIKIGRALSKESEAGRLDRFKEWLKFWGVIISLGIGLIVPLATIAFDHWDKIEHFIRRREKVGPVEQMIEKGKHPKGKKVVRVRVVPAPVEKKEDDELPEVPH